MLSIVSGIGVLTALLTFCIHAHYLYKPYKELKKKIKTLSTQGTLKMETTVEERLKKGFSKRQLRKSESTSTSRIMEEMGEFETKTGGA